MDNTPPLIGYICPVCGYDHLRRPPLDYVICPSCGTEFGYDDFATSHAELRRRWIAGGARWWSPNTPPPQNWSPIEQLARVTRPFIASDLYFGNTVSPTTSRVRIGGQPRYKGRAVAS